MVKNVAVGSENPVKIAAVKTGLRKVFPLARFRVRGITVASGVPAQPRSDEETYNGAFTRAANAKTISPNAEYWIGVEGGIHKTDRGTQSFAWVVILGKDGTIGKSRTATFYLPDAISRLIDEGKELGDADDAVFQVRNSKQDIGAIGLLTHRAINRKELYVPAVICALIPFVNDVLFEDA